jgi:Xaa-Pro aminopeptidase
MGIIDRIRKLRAKFVEKEIDGILISQADNRYYLSGFHGSAGYLLITPEKQVLAVDFRYIEQAKRQAPDYEIIRTAQLADWFPQLKADLNIRRLGFEAGDVTFSFYRQLTDTLQKAGSGLQLVPTDGLVDAFRMVKEPGEIELIQKAVNISDMAADYIMTTAHTGMTELELAWEIEKFMRENGSEAVPFDLIVAAGPNTALPHAQPSNRPVREGEPVLIDIGARCQNYTSDISRTFSLGKPDDKFRKIYDIVLGAQLAAIAIIEAGMTGEQADNIARTVISETGYGEMFGHSLGHGIGIATHEMPRLGMRSTDIMADGMVFSIEPGIYLPEWGGIRIEDTVVLEKGKVKVLSKARK